MIGTGSDIFLTGKVILMPNKEYVVKTMDVNGLSHDVEWTVVARCSEKYFQEAIDCYFGWRSFTYWNGKVEITIEDKDEGKTEEKQTEILMFNKEWVIRLMTREGDWEAVGRYDESEFQDALECYCDWKEQYGKQGVKLILEDKDII